MKRKILVNISINFFVKIITYVFSFLELMYVSRVLQPAIFGRVSFASNFVGYFVMLANLGMPIYAMRACAEIRDHRKELNRIFNELWSLSVVLSIASGIIFGISLLFIPVLRANWVLLALYGSSILLQTVNCDWLYRGLEKFGFLAITSLICKALSFSCIVLFVHSEKNVITYAALSVLIAHGSNVICFSLRGKYVDKTLHFTINKKHLKPLFVFFMMSCAVSIYSNLDLTMLGFMKTEFETGLYSIAAKGKNVLAMTGGLVWGAILPFATTLWKDGAKKQFEELATKSLILVTTFQSLVAIVCMIFAKEIIIIIGGKSYIEAANAFRILLLALPPIAASNILGGQVLIPGGKEKKLLVAEITGAIFNFVANIIVIPRYSIVGASYTTVISEIIVWLLCVYYCKKEIGMDFGVGIFRKIIRKMWRAIHPVVIKCKSLLIGNKLPYYCPCCNTYLHKFADGDFINQPELYNVERYKEVDQNVICPVCGALPRHRILVSWMNENKERFLNKSILYFAQEKAVKTWLVKHGIKCTTADLYNNADLKINIEETGLDDAAYDVIVCNHVLEHVSDYKKALSELYRILSQDGLLILSFPVDTTLSTVYEDDTVVSEEDRIKYFGQNDHKRVFGNDSKVMFDQFGFNAFEISGEDSFCEDRIKPVIGPANYDYNVLWGLTKKGQHFTH